jgi:hypothetical protein
MHAPPAQTPEIKITVGGQPALTADMAAAAHGLTNAAMHKVLRRGGVEPIPGARIGNAPLYLTAAISGALADRPGRGAPGVPRDRPDRRSRQPEPQEPTAGRRR